MQSPRVLPPTHTPASGCSRRNFLASTAAITAATSASRLPAAESSPSTVAFFLVGDTHYLADKEASDKLDPRSQRVTTGLLDTLNQLPGETIPAEAGGGTVAHPRGVIHAGDLIDSGDKNGRQWEKMQATEWNAYTHDFGIHGNDGRLKYPVFEVHGNHDGPQGKGVAIEGIRNRNRHRKTLTDISASGLQCSWDWGPVHFINLGIVVGQVPEVLQRRRYAPLGSLDFLIHDLQTHVGQSQRPVVLTHHIDLARYSKPCAPNDPQNIHREWHPCDVRGFHNAIRNYNVVAILHGHTHARNVLTWDGKSTRAEQGIGIYNVDNSSHFHSDKQAFLYFEIHSQKVLVRECATNDGWQNHFWTPQVWQRKFPTA